MRKFYSTTGLAIQLKLNKSVIDFLPFFPYNVVAVAKLNLRRRNNMNLYFADKLKELRRQKDVSQEKLARYLNVSFQAVSKWENGNAYPDITLLPDIARFFGVTTDELLCVEKPDENRLFEEYSAKASELFRTGKREEALNVWQEAYRRMPNNIDVKEMLMSSYFDTDRNKYFREFIELATEIYNSNDKGRAWNMYYKGQAISQLARCYAERGDIQKAQQWALKSISLFNSCEVISASIDKGDDLLSDASFCTYWFLEELFFIALRINNDDSVKLRDVYKQSCLEAVAKVFEAVYQNDDMGFEQLQHLYELHLGSAEHEAQCGKNEEIVRRHLERAAECCDKSVRIKPHSLTHPMLYGWRVEDAPSDVTPYLKRMNEALSNVVYDGFRSSEWFQALEKKAEVE